MAADSVQRWGGYDMEEEPTGAFVRYADHARIVAEMRQKYEQRDAEARAAGRAMIDMQQAHAAALAAAQVDADTIPANLIDAWIEVGREAAAAPRTLTADEQKVVHRLIGELAGYASMCWTPSPSTQKFDSTRAAAAVETTVAAILTLIHDEEAPQDGPDSLCGVPGCTTCGGYHDEEARPQRCPKCRHAYHLTPCLNMASDGECGIGCESSAIDGEATP